MRDIVERTYVGLNPQRKHTEAEVDLVMFCFKCSRREARSILSANVSPEMLAEARGMLDAARLEREIENGRKIEVPEWLKNIKNDII